MPSVAASRRRVLSADDRFFYYGDMQAERQNVLHLRWADLPTAGGYHAALFSSRDGPRGQVHTQDFFELMYVLAGVGTHQIAGWRHSLQAGDLILIRPGDRHTIDVPVGRELSFVNIAFPADAWLSFRALVGLAHDALGAGATDPPPTVRVPLEGRDECARLFRRALHAFHEAPSRLELCGFWARVMPFLPRFVEGEPADDALPPWLRTACWAMQDETNLQFGLPRFVELSGVSRAHLSRTLKASGGQTPTEFINDLRLKRAALLLTTTTREIVEIATESGFANLSYFYRLFGQRYAASPRRFRLQARRSVAP